jgi:N-methylhydantoinase A
VVHDYVQSEVRLLYPLDIGHLQATFDELETRARHDLQREGFGSGAVTRFIRELDVRYAGQGHELRVGVTSGSLDAEEKVRITRQFHDLHHRLRGHRAQDEPLEIVSYRLRAEVEVPQYRPVPSSEPAAADPPKEARSGARLVSFGRGQAPISTPAWRREYLRFGNRLCGPAIVEQVDATTVIPPGWIGALDGFGNLVLTGAGRP